MWSLSEGIWCNFRLTSTEEPAFGNAIRTHSVEWHRLRCECVHNTAATKGLVHLELYASAFSVSVIIGYRISNGLPRNAMLSTIWLYPVPAHRMHLFISLAISQKGRAFAKLKITRRQCSEIGFFKVMQEDENCIHLLLLEWKK